MFPYSFLKYPHYPSFVPLPRYCSSPSSVNNPPAIFSISIFRALNVVVSHFSRLQNEVQNVKSEVCVSHRIKYFKGYKIASYKMKTVYISNAQHAVLIDVCTVKMLTAVQLMTRATSSQLLFCVWWHLKHISLKPFRIQGSVISSSCRAVHLVSRCPHPTVILYYVITLMDTYHFFFFCSIIPNIFLNRVYFINTY